MQNLGGQTKNIMVFSELAYSLISLTIHVKLQNKRVDDANDLFKYGDDFRVILRS